MFPTVFLLVITSHYKLLMCVPEVHVPLQSQSQDVGESSSRTTATNQNHHRCYVSQLEALEHNTVMQTGYSIQRCWTNDQLCDYLMWMEEQSQGGKTLLISSRQCQSTLCRYYYSMAPQSNSPDAKLARLLYRPVSH